MIIRKFVLLLGDIFLLYLSLLLMLLIRFRHTFNYSVWKDHVFPFSVVFIVWIIVFYMWDMYSLSFEKHRENYISAMVMSILLAMTMFYIASGTKISPKTNLIITFGIFSVFFFLWRLFCYKIFIKLKSFVRVAVIGSNQRTIEIINRINNKSEGGYKVVYVAAVDGNKIRKKDIPPSVEAIPDYKNIFTLAEKKNIDLVVVSNEYYAQIFESLYKLIKSGISVYHIASFWEEFEESIPLDVTGDLWFLENIREEKKRIFELIKRGTDIMIAILIFPFVMVFSVLIALAVVVSSRGPMIYRQVRVGKYKSEFYLYKFRTMIQNAEQNGPQWSGVDDKRITKIGKILRVLRLDELPQIYNIIRGDMSFVGPRPERPEFVNALERKIPHYNFRHFTKPGLTGWAQINAPYASSLEDSANKLEYDLYYIKNRSFMLDIKILLKTIIIILKRKGR